VSKEFLYLGPENFGSWWQESQTKLIEKVSHQKIEVGM
jgi:hypothetical protein